MYQRRRKSGVDTVRCSATRKIATAIEAIRRTNDVGVILAEAGLGKSRAVDHYCEQNPTSLLLQVRGWCNDKHSIEAMVAGAVGGYDGKRKRSVWLTEKLSGGGRTLIVDDAHKLTRPALQWLFDFHDETNCPLALVGIGDLEKKVKDDAQRFSRTGLLVRLEADESDEALIGHLIASLAPQATTREVAGNQQPADSTKESGVSAETMASASTHRWFAQLIRRQHRQLLRKLAPPKSM